MMSIDTDRIVYRIIHRATGILQGVYSRAYHDDHDFESAERARESNCHGEYQDRKRYKVSKYKVSYELLEDDCEDDRVSQGPPETPCP
jgi:hypothetical protein